MTEDEYIQRLRRTAASMTAKHGGVFDIIRRSCRLYYPTSRGDIMMVVWLGGIDEFDRYRVRGSIICGPSVAGTPAEVLSLVDDYRKAADVLSRFVGRMAEVTVECDDEIEELDEDVEELDEDDIETEDEDE